MSKQSKCNSIVSINQCSRFSFGVIKNTTIKEVLSKNKWIFSESWNFWAYCKQVDAIRMSAHSIDPFIDDKYILFSNELHKFCDWENIINWDEYGAWYSYNFPTLIPKVKECLLLGRECDLPSQNSSNSSSFDYSGLGKEWQFIHNIRPDVFVVKNNSDVIVGASDFHSIWSIRRHLSN